MTTLVELFAGKGPVLGTWSQIGAPEVVDMLGAAGFRFTILDAEHGSFGMESVENLVRACDAARVVPLVRVPSLDPAQITRALDAGAQAVLVPGIRSLAEAQRAVNAGRFAPAGSRGACPCVRAGGHWIADWRGYANERERDTGVAILAETPGALQDIELICRVDGLKAIVVGPFDLSVALGLGGDTRHPDVLEAVQRMIAVTIAANVPVVVPVFAPDLEETQRQIAQWQHFGVRLFTIGTDKILLHSQASRFVASLSDFRA